MRQRGSRVRLSGTVVISLMALVTSACFDSKSGSNDSASTASGAHGTDSGQIAVSVVPTSATALVGGDPIVFSATVSNTATGSVSWQVSGIPGGNSQVGTISVNGAYAPPAAVPTPATVMVTAVADADPSKSATAPVIVTATPTSSSSSGSGASSSGSNSAGPGVPTGLSSTGITPGSIGLSWTASSDSGGPGVAGYYVYRNGALVASVTGPSYTDTPLVASTTYRYQVAAFDSAATPKVSAQSAVLSATTAADTQPPSVPAGVAASAIAPTSLTLTWSASTDLPVPGATGVGGYYVNRNGMRVATVTSGTSFADHGLATGDSYSYQIAAYDKATPANVSALSAALAVTTVNDTAAPTVPMGLSATSIATGSVSLSWSAATDLPNPGGTGVGGYYLYRNGARVATVTATSYQDTPLTASTPYSYQVAAFDRAATPNISALSAMLNLTTAADTQAPTVPGGLSASGVTASGLTLNWAASTDLPTPGAVGVAGYYVYRGGVRVATVTSGTSFTDSGLTGSTHYSYQLAAFDKVTPTPNVSALSAAYTASTAGDTQPPTVPAGLTASSVSVASVTLSWSASTDLPNPGGTGVGGYYVYRNGARVGNVTATGYTDNNLTASTTYSYQVAAFDKVATPNVSTLSSALPVTTLPDTVPPTVPTGLTATNVGLTSATLSWNASTDLPNPGATGVGGYVVYRGGVSVGTTASTGYTDNSLAPGSSYSYQVAAFDKATPTPNTSSMSAAYAVTTNGNMTVTPANAALTLSQTQQFTTNAASGTSLNWYVDGVQGGSSALGTISSSGSYTPPATPGTHTVRAASSSNPSVNGSAVVAVTNLSAVTTYQYDLARTGQNLQEYALTPATVSSGSFGKRWSCPLDGIVYAQPLYMANLPIGGATHNVLFVATMHDSVYAFDADSGSCVPLWKTSFINSGAGVTTTPSNCADTPTEYGISGTPVIDPASQTLYLVASTNESTGTVQRLHALNILNGADRGTPTVIQAQIAGTGDYGTTVTFNALVGNQRPGLVLTNGNVYITWASHCDTNTTPWHGWLMSYNASSLAQTGILSVTPNGNWGGIWMSGAAPAVDSSGRNLYFSTGNGAFDNTSAALPALSPNNDFGESFLNVNPATLQVQDFYTPSQYSPWAQHDLDISSGAVTLLPDGMGPVGHANVLIGTDKQGHLWMIDRNSMSGYVPGLDNTVQLLTLPGASTYSVHSATAYWNGTLYSSVGNGPLMAFQLANGLVPSNGSNVAVAASQSAQTYKFPNPTPSISAAPNGNAIVWTLDQNANGTTNGSAALGPAILRAYDATNLATLLYSSSTRSADAAGNASKFIVPVVANGHVYVVGHDALTVYGLTP